MSYNNYRQSIKSTTHMPTYHYIPTYVDPCTYIIPTELQAYNRLSDWLPSTCQATHVPHDPIISHCYTVSTVIGKKKRGLDLQKCSCHRPWFHCSTYPQESWFGSWNFRQRALTDRVWPVKALEDGGRMLLCIWRHWMQSWTGKPIWRA